MKKWVQYEREEDKKELLEAVFTAIDATGAETLTDLRTNPIKCASAAQKAISGMDREKRDRVAKFIGRLITGK